MADQLTWQISTDPEATQVKVIGNITEFADFAALVKQLKDCKKVRLDLSQVERINSCGVREWINFVGPLSRSVDVVMEKCSPAIVGQVNVFRAFAGEAKISSIQVPFFCNSCEALIAVDVEVTPGTLPHLDKVSCPKCMTEMVFDDVPEEYFAFLR